MIQLAGCIWLKIGRKLLTNHARQDQLTLPSNAALFNLGSRLWLFEGSGIIRFRIPHGSSDRWIWASSQSSCRAMDIHTYSHNIKRLGRVLSVTYYSGHIQTVERVWLTFQSGHIWSTFFQIACRTSTQVHPGSFRNGKAGPFASFSPLLSSKASSNLGWQASELHDMELQLSFIYN